MAKKAKAPLFESLNVPAPAKRFNHYACEACGQITIAKHEDQGVTPFMLGCRATPGCSGSAFSKMYQGSQDPAQVPHVIWFRPTDPGAVDAAIEAELVEAKRRGRLTGIGKREHDVLLRGMREHYAKGGCLIKVAS